MGLALTVSLLERILRRVVFGVQPNFSVLCAAFYNESLIGAVAVRLEQQQDGTARLYFITLGVLAPYRSCGIGETLLTQCLLHSCRAPWVPWHESSSLLGQLGLSGIIMSLYGIRRNDLGELRRFGCLEIVL